MTDPTPPVERALALALARLAALPGLVVSERQLYYEVCRALRPAPGLDVPGAWGLLGVGAVRALAGAGPWALAGAAAASGLALLAARRLPHTRTPPIDLPTFTAALARHTAAHGRPPALLAARPGVHLGLDGREPDLWDYGLARALVVDDDDLAAALLATGIHLELGCAVFGRRDAAPLPAPVRAMLARTPGARVLALHHADAASLAALPDLRARLGLPAQVGLAPVGLRPAHARALHLFAGTGTPPPADRLARLAPGLTAAERRWLAAGHTAELAAVHPLRLLRSLRRLVLEIRRPSAPTRAARRAGGFMTVPPT
jgi:hypothetical protein